MNQTRKLAALWITQMRERLKIIEKHGSLANAAEGSRPADCCRLTAASGATKKAGETTFTYTLVYAKGIRVGDIIKRAATIYEVKEVIRRDRTTTLHERASHQNRKWCEYRFLSIKF